jgi:cobaltochelatase CobN
MQRKYVLPLVLSVLLLASLTTVVSADENKINIMYIGWTPSPALEAASKSMPYSSDIVFTYVPSFNTTTWASPSDELLSAASSGLLMEQDVIFTDMLSSAVFEPMNSSFKAAKDNGISLVDIRSLGTPEYFDYISDGSSTAPIDTYYSNMGTTGEGLRNAENLLIYLATEYSNLSEIIDRDQNSNDAGSDDNSPTGSISIGSGDTKFLFLLGTDINSLALASAAAESDISSELSTTIILKNETVPRNFNFSEYSLIFIESWDEVDVNSWIGSINAAKENGAKVIGYNLSENITLPNVDLYSGNYTDIERYWIQGGENNMGNMLKFMGQKFTGAFAGQTIVQPEILQEKLNITYIINSDTSIYYLKQVLAERAVITDRFNVNVMTGTEAMKSSVDFTKEDVIILYMVGANELPELKDDLLAARNNGAQIGMFGMLADVYGIATFDMANPPHDAMTQYLYNDGFNNMENWIRCIGATLKNLYIEYAVAQAPEIPDDGIYHPDAFPRIFADSKEYLEWYANHGYNASAPTIGIIGNKLGKTPVEYNSENAIIRELESRGCNVIYTTYAVCTDDVDYFTKDGEVLVDSIISLKGFYLNYNDHEKGIEYLQKYNVPVIKGIQDYYQTPAEFNASVQGLSSSSIAYQVTQPEIDGLTDYIWVAGRVQDPETQQYYYEPLACQIEWICDRAIAWAELGRKKNAEKKVTIIYYNHDGGKNNIGASYLDIGSSFTLLLDNMKSAGYNIGNGTIPNGSEFIDLFIESRNVGTWAPGELEKVVQSGYVTLLPVEKYLEWYNTLPKSVRDEVEDTWGKVPGNVMTYKNSSGEYFVIPTIQLGNVNFIPQPTRAALSDESLIYHNSSIPPTHQYLATYFWINNIYDADAIVHFGTHGTQEWLPGNEVGLWRYDYPSIMVAETPVIYPYIMDNVGEGTQAKRRGNAVIIDHLTPPIIEAGLYGDLATMHDKIHNYEKAKMDNESAMMTLYRNSTIQLYGNLSLEENLGVSTDELYNMTVDEFDNFLDNVLHDYLHELKSELMPYGLHVFGVAPQEEKLVCMVKSMLGKDFISHIYDVLAKDNGTEEDWNIKADSDAMLLLNATILNGTNVSTAQLEILGLTNASITADLELAVQYADKLVQTTREIDQTLKALNAEYIEPGTGNDPIRNPGALPTGKNFYSFDQRTIPDEETEAMGSAIIDAWLENYYAANGTYPNKVAFVMWSVETMRHKGLMEAQIYALLGVELERTSGRITGFKVIPQEEMTHPRIDVLITTSGLYRDTFPYQIELIDTAVRMVAELNETNETNYVRWNSLSIKDAMLQSGYNESTAHNVSMCRLFSEATGTYGTGVSEAVEASNTWENVSEVADLYISRMSNVYGKNVWGVNYEDVFKLNLGDVNAAIHSDTSNLYGLIDNDDYYSYFGALGLAVKSIAGVSPSMYIADLKRVDNPEIITLRKAFSTELTARYLNPNWITGMMEYDYAGAREMMKVTEYMWGWEATTSELVTDSDWNKMYETYILDSQNLGLDEFLKKNPYQYQSITARMLETIRKDSWDASDEVVQNLVKEYVESVVENGVTCCHHTCGNPSLNEFIQGVMSVPGLVNEQTASEYKKLMLEATTEPVKESISSSSRSSSRGPKPEITNQTVTSGSTNQTFESLVGAGTDLSQPAPEAPKSTPENYVEGYEMTKETIAPPESSTPAFSGSDIIAFLLVIGAAGAVFLGFRRRGKV